MQNEIIVYSISDSLNETSQKLLSTVMIQYPNLALNNNYTFPFVNQKGELLAILADALHDKAIAISTLVNHELSEVAKSFSRKTGLLYIDLMQPLFEIIHTKTGIQPIEDPMAVHKLDTEYFNRISAIEFAVKYDDGKDPKGFLYSDIILLGVSRTSKTPLSMYLANKGYKVSNLPLIPEVPLPKILEEVDKNKIVGLICHPETLVRIRSNRLDSLGLHQSSSYSNLETIHKELAHSQKIFDLYGSFVIDISDKSIEETAFIVEHHLKSLK